MSECNFCASCQGGNSGTANSRLLRHVDDGDMHGAVRKKGVASEGRTQHDWRMASASQHEGAVMRADGPLKQPGRRLAQQGVAEGATELVSEYENEPSTSGVSASSENATTPFSKIYPSKRCGKTVQQCKTRQNDVLMFMQGNSSQEFAPKLHGVSWMLRAAKTSKGRIRLWSGLWR